jgi:hypothetical protein
LLWNIEVRLAPKGDQLILKRARVNSERVVPWHPALKEEKPTFPFSEEAKSLDKIVCINGFNGLEPFAIDESVKKLQPILLTTGD